MVYQMKKILLLISICISSIAQAQYNHIEVQLLGTFHFGDTPDLVDGGFTDLFTVRRQREIRRIVDQIAAWQPNKIYVENTAEAQAYWDEVFTAYKKGSLKPERQLLENEIFQLGIRSAAKIPNSPGVICVNFTHSDPVAKKTELTNNWASYYQSLLGLKPTNSALLASNQMLKDTFDGYLAKYKTWQKLPLNKHLLEMNATENLQTLHYINVLSFMDNNVAGVGAELASLEYRRNLKIVQNIYMNLQQSDKKILIIYGAGHIYSLKNILDSHPVFEVKDLSEMLH